MKDIVTVMWKESKGLMLQGNSRARAAANQLVIVGMMALLLPLQLGRDWPSHALSLVATFIVPLMTVGITIPESFAGERERHTLETLLASRLPDRAILLGKLLTGILYGWVMTLGTLILGLIVVNIVFGKGEFLFFSNQMLAAHLTLSLLVCCFMAGIGVLISLRSETAQGAQQAAVSVMLIPLLLIQVVPVLFMTVVPDGMKKMMSFLESLNAGQVLAGAALILLVVDILLLVAVISRFQRARLASG